MNKLKNTNKQGEKLLLSGMAAATLGLISTKPKIVKAANLNGNRSTFKKAKRVAVKTKINYQTARSKLTRRGIDPQKPQTTHEATKDMLTGQKQSDSVSSNSSTIVTMSDETEQGSVSNNIDNQNKATNKNNNEENSSNSNTSQDDNQNIDSKKFDPSQATKTAVTSTWNGLKVSYESDTDELTIYGGEDTPAVISNNIEPIDGNINDVASNYIKTITIKGKIKIIGSADNLFANLFNLETINGLENIDTQEITNMAKMFSGSYKLSSLDLSSFDTSSVTDMNSMFYGCSSLKNLKFDSSKFNTAKVTNMASMFKNCGVQSIDLSRFNTSNVTNMADMFSGCAVTSLDLSHFDTAKVTDMSGMFNSNILQALDVSCLDTAKVTNMAKMFANSKNLTSINFGTKDATKFNTSNVTDMSDMFNTSEKLTDIDLSTFNTAKVTNMADMFFSCKALTGLDLSPLDTSNVTDMNGMFQYCNGLTSLDVSPLETAKVTNMARMFYSCQGLTSLDVSTFKTSNVTSMEDMFDYCSSLTDLKFGDPGTTTFDTSNVVTMKNMFAYCSAMVNLDLSAFDTSKVEVFTLMFDNCSRLANLNLSSFKTSAKTNVSGGISMDYMFQNCTSLATIDVSHFDTSNVGNMMGMFRDCFSLASLDLTNFDTSNVSDMSDMFNQCTSLKRLNLSSFDTSNVTNMYFMFANSGLERLDISNFDMSNVSNTFNMLGGLKNLKILVLGKKNKIGTSPFNDELNSGFNTSGTWTNMGSGQVPKDQNSWSADQLVNKYDPSKDYDTYVNFSAPSLITVKYQDSNQKDIVPSDQLYDFKNTALLDTLPTFNSRKLNRNTDYQLEHIELDGKTVSDLKNVKFGDTPQTITFFYKSAPAEPVAAKPVKVYYKYKDEAGNLHDILDETGKPKTKTISGNIGDKPVVTFDDLANYKKDSYQINTDPVTVSTDNPAVTLSDQDQTVTLIYTKNSAEPVAAKPVKVYYKYRDKDDHNKLHDILDETGKPKTKTISGKIGDKPTVTFDDLANYKKDSYQINTDPVTVSTDNPAVTLSDQDQTVTLIYTKNSAEPVAAKPVKVYYKYRDKDDHNKLHDILDETGKPKTKTISGKIGDKPTVTFDDLANYKKDSYQINTDPVTVSTDNPAVTLSDQKQTVTLIYTQDSGNGTNTDNGSGNHNTNTPGNNNNNTPGNNNNNTPGNNSSNGSGSNNTPGNSSSNGSGNNGSGSNGQNNGSNLPNNEPNNIPTPVNRKPKTVRPHKTINKGFNIKDQNAIHNQQLANSLKNNGSSSNTQNSASNPLPQTGNDKHNSLAMLALGGLALASALSAIWFNHKED